MLPERPRRVTRKQYVPKGSSWDVGIRRSAVVSFTVVMSRDKLGFNVWTMKELLLYIDLWRNVYELWLMPGLL